VVEVTEQASSYLHQTSKKLRRQALPTVEEHVLQGHPAVAIIDYARSISDNIIAMARNPGDPVLVVHAHDPESAKE